MKVVIVSFKTKVFFHTAHFLYFYSVRSSLNLWSFLIPCMESHSLGVLSLDLEDFDDISLPLRFSVVEAESEVVETFDVLFILPSEGARGVVFTAELLSFRSSQTSSFFASLAGFPRSAWGWQSGEGLSLSVVSVVGILPSADVFSSVWFVLPTRL